MKLLIIEDDHSLGELMLKALKAEGHVVELAMDFHSAVEKVGVYDYDCILLDINLPGGSGLDLLERMKKDGIRSDVIIISARDSIDDKVRGLELGADDYLAKPFHMAELMARIRSVARRSRNDGDFGYKAGNVFLDEVSRTVSVAGQQLELLKKEFDILKYFMMRPGHTVDKAVLAEAVWGDHIDQSDDFQFVYAQMKNLRKKLSDAGADIEIKSIYGFGYKLLIP
jgi:DNA-binding response OmpR family regulator